VQCLLTACREWKQFAHYDPKRYVRNLLAFNDHFSLIMCCWNLEQETPKHTHKGAECWVKVLDGTLVSTQYVDGKPVKVKKLAVGSTSHSLDEEYGVHTTGNASKDKTALSLHLFSPPYLEVDSGSSVIPVVYCSDQARQQQSETELFLRKHVYSNFQSLFGVLDRYFAEPCSPEKVRRIVEAFEFNSK
jgi:hypothetical protein